MLCHGRRGILKSRGVRGSVWDGLRFGLDPLASMRFGEKSTRNRPQCGLRFVRIGFAVVRAVAGSLRIELSFQKFIFKPFFFSHFVNLYFGPFFSYFLKCSNIND